jgi:four helix bundle protein
MAGFDAYDVSLALARALRPTSDRIARRDPDLARQLRRAAGSVVQCVSEGAERRGRYRLHLWRVAAGSAAEIGAVLDLAEAWGYATACDLADERRFLDRVRALLFRLTHPRA